MAPTIARDVATKIRAEANTALSIAPIAANVSKRTHVRKDLCNMKTRNRGGLEYALLTPGGFYQCVSIGGFTCATTGITIPGGKAVLDGNNRSIVKVVDLPDPVQIPTHRIVRERKVLGDPRSEMVENEIGFTEYDSHQQGIHEALQLALSTGVIREVDDETLERHYPEALAKRQNKIVWREISTREQRPLSELVAEAQERMLHERADAERSRQEAQQQGRPTLN